MCLRLRTALVSAGRPCIAALLPLSGDGPNARNKARIVTNPIHIKLEAPHPSPLSAYNGFFGCRHFSKANDWLVRTGQTPIDWRIE